MVVFALQPPAIDYKKESANILYNIGYIQAAKMTTKHDPFNVDVYLKRVGLPLSTKNEEPTLALLDKLVMAHACHIVSCYLVLQILSFTVSLFGILNVTFDMFGDTLSSSLLV